MHIYLSDIPEDKVYILLKKEVRHLIFNRAFSKFKRKQELADLLNFRDGYSLTRYQKGRRYCPLKLLKKICKIIEMDLDSLQDKIESIKYGTNGKTGLSKKVIRPNFPIKLNGNISYLIAKFIGDGTITITKFGSLQCSYRNNDLTLKKELTNKIKICFGKTEFREDNRSIYFPSFIGLILLMFNNDYMSHTATIPERIRHNNKTIKSNFLRAIYEDEGCVTKRKSIVIAMANKQIIFRIHRLLGDVGISPNKIVKIVKSNKDGYKRRPQHRFSITGRENLIKFYQKIGFSKGYYKRQLLHEQISSYKNKQRRIGETSKLIYNLLNDKGTLSTLEICEMLIMRRSNTLHHLRSLFKQNKISKLISPPIQNNKGIFLGNLPCRWSIKT